MRSSPTTELDLLDRLRDDERALERDVQQARDRAAILVEAARQDGAAMVASAHDALDRDAAALRETAAREHEAALARLRAGVEEELAALRARAAGNRERALSLVLRLVEAPP
jgi:hypothetical protein